MELFTPEFGLVFWMFVVFALLFFLLAKFAWPFIVKSLEERAELIDKGVLYAKEAKKYIAEAQMKQAEILREAAKMKSQIIEDAKTAASVEAKKVMDAAKLAIEQARKESELQFRNEVSAFALNIAEKMVRKNMATDKAQTELVDKLLNEVEVKN